MTTPYQRLIAEALADTPYAVSDPRHVEAVMRDAEQTGCLDGLSPADFRAAALQAAAFMSWAVDSGERGLPEDLARSYGL